MSQLFPAGKQHIINRKMRFLDGVPFSSIPSCVPESLGMSWPPFKFQSSLLAFSQDFPTAAWSLLFHVLFHFLPIAGMRLLRQSKKLGLCSPQDKVT